MERMSLWNDKTKKGNITLAKDQPHIRCNKRELSAEYVQLLMREASHRSKNLLMLVQAIIRQTARDIDPDTLVDKLCERIEGLAASQDLLVHNEWRGVDLADLVCSQFAYLKDLIGQRVVIDGPSVWLLPTAAHVIGMALHELVTNSCKYGALSCQKGMVRIGWSIVQCQQARQFHLDWSEHDGPIVTAPKRKGFGHTVTVRMVEQALSCKVELSYQSSGVVWWLSAPVETTLIDIKQPRETLRDEAWVRPIELRSRPARDDCGGRPE
jgi:two-component sensor histidine kinase